MKYAELSTDKKFAFGLLKPGFHGEAFCIGCAVNHTIFIPGMFWHVGGAQ